MKFLALVLSALAGLASANTRISTKEINRRLKNGHFNKKTLLAKARPYGRRAEEGEQEQFEITGDYSIQFTTCFSLKMESQDMFDDENILALAADEIVVAEKSLVLFNVCQTEYCYYEAEDAANTYVVDVATFIQALAEYLPNQRNDYCEACEENRDYCENYLGWVEQDEAADEGNGDEAEGEGEGEEGGQEGEDGEGEGEDGGEGEGEEGEGEGEGEGEEGEGEGEGEGERRLAQKNVEYIDCDKCVSLQCIEQEDEENQGDEEEEKEMDYDNALEWIQEIAECAQLEYENDDFEGLYGGFICNEEGDGVELAVFLDEDCTLYHKQLPFGNFVDDDDANNYYKSATIIQTMFTEDLNCAFDEIEYVNPDDYNNGDENQDEGQDEDEDNQALEICQNLFNGEFEAVSIANCEGDDEDEEDNNDEEDLCEGYDWCSYDLSEEDANDEQAVCRIVNDLDGEYYTVYSNTYSGQYYDYSKASQSSNSTGGSMKGGAIFGIIILVAVACVGAAWAFSSKKKDRGDKKKPLISGSMA